MPAHGDLPRSPENRPEPSQKQVRDLTTSHQAESQHPASQTPDIKRGRGSSPTDKTHPEQTHDAPQSPSSPSKDLVRIDQTSKELVRISDLPSKELVLYNGNPKLDPISLAQAQEFIHVLKEALKMAHDATLHIMARHAEEIDREMTLALSLGEKYQLLQQKIQDLPRAYQERIDQAIGNYRQNGQQLLKRYEQIKKEREVERELQRPPLPGKLVDELVQMERDLPPDLAESARAQPAETRTSPGTILFSSPELQPLLEQGDHHLQNINRIVHEEVQVHEAMTRLDQVIQALDQFPKPPGSEDQ